MALEQCQNCECTIGKLEKAFVFNNNIVCSECYAKLNKTKGEHSNIRMVKCPYCAKEIPDGSTICKYCKSNLEITIPLQSSVRPPITNVLWIGIGIIILLCLFPPWEVHLVSERFGSTTYYDHHWFNWDTQEMFERIPASQKNLYPRYSGLAIIAYPRLVVECVIVALITGGVFKTFKGKKSVRPWCGDGEKGTF